MTYFHLLHRILKRDFQSKDRPEEEDLQRGQSPGVAGLPVVLRRQVLCQDESGV